MEKISISQGFCHKKLCEFLNVIFSKQKKLIICSDAYFYVGIIDISTTEILAKVKNFPVLILAKVINFPGNGIFKKVKFPEKFFVPIKLVYWKI